jgi:hypothetical protein
VQWPLWRVAVTERSMEPGLAPGDWLLAWRGWRRGRPLRVRPGRIVLARQPEDGLLLVKRAARLQAGGWWLESDNPGAGAVDSRRFGPVPPAAIEAIVLGRYGCSRDRR